jgi:transposase
MSNRKRTYTKQFKEEAIALWEASEKPASTIEQELGITAGLLSRWRRKKRQQTQTVNGRQTDELTDKRVRELERENARLRQEREILKKAVAIFVPESR